MEWNWEANYMCESLRAGKAGRGTGACSGADNPFWASPGQSQAVGAEVQLVSHGAPLTAPQRAAAPTISMQT